MLTHSPLKLRRLSEALRDSDLSTPTLRSTGPAMPLMCRAKSTVCLLFALLFWGQLLGGCGDDTSDSVTIGVAAHSESPGMDIPGLWYPAAVHVDADGNIWVAEK